MRNKLKSDSGYTLVELIIVIAIIAIMSGAGIFTVSAIRTSQATASMQKFDSELSALEMRTKTQKNGEAIRIVKNDANYDVYYGTCSDGTATTFVATSSTPDKVLERVTIYYAEDYDADSVSTPLDDQVIIIRKSDGQVLAGYGEYRFCKTNTSNTVGRVTLNQYTGGHTYGKN